KGVREGRPVVNFARVLKEVLWCLVTEGGISYRRIRLSYGLDGDALEELRRELISVKRLAADVDGERLVWAPEGLLTRNERATLPQHPLPRCVLRNQCPPLPRRQLWLRRGTCPGPRGGSLR